MDGNPLAGLDVLAFAGDGVFVIGPLPGAFGNLRPDFDHGGIGEIGGQMDIEGEKLGASGIRRFPAQRQRIDANGGLAIARRGDAFQFHDAGRSPCGIGRLRQRSQGIAPELAKTLCAGGGRFKVSLDL